MESPLAAVFWFCVLVLAPGLAGAALHRRMRPYRLNLPPGTRMDLCVLRWSDTDSRNYSEPGKRLLRLFGVLHVLQVFGFVLWGALFIL